MRLSREDFKAIKAKQTAKRERRADNAAFQARIAGKPKPKSKAIRDALMEDCLDLGSKFIRLLWAKITGGLCAFGCGRPIQCWFHFVKQSRSLKVRFDPRNIVGACFICNGKMEHSEGWAWAWYVKTYSIDQMNAMLFDSHGRAGFGITHFEAIRKYFKDGIAELGGWRWPAQFDDNKVDLQALIKKFTEGLNRS